MAAVDRELFHKYLWKNTDRNGFLKLTQKELMDRLQVSQRTMSRLYDELIDSGKLVKHGDRTFRVIDPSISAWD